MKTPLLLLLAILPFAQHLQAKTPRAPAPAATSGFTHLVFDDEFTGSSVIDPAKPSSAPTWYRCGKTIPDSISINTGAGTGKTAGARGVLTINNSPNIYNAVLQTIPANATASQRAGTWQHAYFEARIQYSPTVTGHGGPKAGWPSFWLWSVQALSPVEGQKTAECDILEAWPAGTAGASSKAINTLHNWQNGKTNASQTHLYSTEKNNLQVRLIGSSESAQPTDGAWHTYGCLWTSTGKDSGAVQFYYDGFLIAHQGGITTFLTGTNQRLASGEIDGDTMGTALTAMESDNLCLVLGTAQGWPMNVNWVRVWQSPPGT